VYAVVWAVSSGGERLVDTEEVTGSNPVSPTILKARVSPSSKALRVSGGFLLFGGIDKEVCNKLQYTVCDNIRQVVR
jgi:hypothetical protein